MFLRRSLGYVAIAVLVLASSCKKSSSGPKLTLRYHPPAGADYRYTLEQHSSMKFESGPMAQMPQQTLTMKMYLSQSVTGPRDSGIGVTVTIDSTTIDSPNYPTGSFAPALNQMRGMKSNIVYDPRMNVVHAELAGAAGPSPISDQIGRSIKNLVFPLPADPVGIGDSWTTESELPMGQMGGSSGPAKAKTKLTVKEIHAEGADTSVLLGVETSYPTDPIAVSAEGQTQTLKLSGNLTGEQLFSVTKGAAVRSNVEGTVHVHITGGFAGQQGSDMAMQQATILQLNNAK